jgi:hypothetical protein
MKTTTEQFKQKFVALSESMGAPVQNATVLPSNAIFTYHGEASAKKMALVLSKVLKNVKVYQSLRDGKTTDMKCGLRRPVVVWCVGGWF